MNCPKCNGPMEMGSLFCPHCGAKVDNNGNTLTQENNMINNSLNNGDNVSLTNTNDGVPIIMNNVEGMNTNSGVNLNSGIEQGSLNGSDIGMSNGGTFNTTGLNNSSVNSVNENSSISADGLVNNMNTGSLDATNSTNTGNNFNTDNSSNMSNMNFNNSVGINNQANLNVNSTSPVSAGSVGVNNVGPNISGMNTNMNNNVSSQNMNISNNNPNVNSNTISKVNKSGNLITIILVLVIAIVAVVVCYLMISGNKSNTTNKDKNVVATNNTSEVTVNGRTGKVPKGWSFVSGIEVGYADYESVFVKDTKDSVAFVSTSSDVTFDSVKNGMYAIKAKLESSGFSDLNVTTDKKNGVEYVLFDGLFNGANYHVLFYGDGVGVSGSEGYYASSEDLATIINFVTGLKKNTAIKGIASENNINLFNSVLGK